MDKEMKNELAVTNTSTNEIVLYQPNEQMSLEVKLENETVWLKQQQIADLFGVKRPAANSTRASSSLGSSSLAASSFPWS